MKLLKHTLYITTLLLSTQLYATTYEDGTGKDNWKVYDNTPSGTSIDTLYDQERDSEVITLNGTGTQNGYILGNWEGRDGAWNNTTDKTMQWHMKFKEAYVVYIRVMTAKGARYIYYTNSEISYGKRNNDYIHIGLGKQTSNDTWQSITRDLEKDLKQYEPNNSLTAVNAFLVRGNGFVDDVELVSEKNKIESMDASHNKEILTLTMQGQFIKGSHGSFFIDADNDSSTGYSGGTVKGADYLIQHTAIYRYPDDDKGWKWDKISSEVKTETTTSRITSKVPLNMIDITDDTINYIGAVSMPDWKNRINYKQMQEYTMLEGGNVNTVVIGARPVKPTPIAQGKLFASPHGDGNCMSVQSACDIYTAVNKLSSSNNILFLRGGTYNLNKQLVISKYKNGTLNNPIIIESYPHEKAILNGNATIDKIKQGVSPVGGIYTEGKDKYKYLKIRNIEIKKIGGPGIILMRTKGITIEGCKIHNNYLSGIKLLGSDENTIIDNHIYNNSDKGLTKIGFLNFDNGGNADAIQIIYSEKSLNNIISHNIIHHNSDDGIDAIGGIDTTISYNLSYNNLGIKGGKNGGHGNGIGIKACGKNARRAKVEHNIAFNNNGNGMECHVNNGDGVMFAYNTAYGNGNYGFGLPDITNVTLHHNISSNNAKSQVSYGNQSSNSWEIKDNINFISTDPNSNNFLKPKDELFKNMGAYANLPKENNSKIKIFAIGDSTVRNRDFEDHEMGWANQAALGSYMKNSANLYNYAQSGTSSTSYKTVSDSGYDWEETQDLINNSDIVDRAYLLIQFGHNNKDYDYEKYTNDLREYINDARALGVIPVLVTPVQRLWKYTNSHKELPKAMKEVAEEKNVLLIDLNAKSKQIFSTYKSQEDVQSTFGYDDHTHFNPEGAKIVAGWIKDLICEKDEKLCSVFK